MFPTLHFGEHRFAPEYLAAEAARVAAGLAEMGVQEGMSVAVMLRNGPSCVTAVLACRQAGLYLVPLNWHFKAAEAGHVLRDSGARALVVHSHLVEQIRDTLVAQQFDAWWLDSDEPDFHSNLSMSSARAGEGLESDNYLVAAKWFPPAIRGAEQDGGPTPGADGSSFPPFAGGDGVFVELDDRFAIFKGVGGLMGFPRQLAFFSH